VSNGGDENESCDASHPFHGGVLKLDGSPGGATVAKGFRNPIAVRCPHGKNLCFAVELAKDYSGNKGGREKLVPIRAGDDWGFPCCATKNLPYENNPGADCSAVASEDDGFFIGDTPFGVDFAPEKWPAPYKGSAIVALHGEVSHWIGSKIVAIEVDP